MENFLILQLIAHLITDFYFQNDLSCEQKKETGFRSKYLYIHTLITFAVAWLFSFSLNFVLYALVIGICHLLIDGIKSLLKDRKYAFFADQILHIAIIVSVVWFFNGRTGISLPEWLPETYWLFMTLSVIICMKPTNILIKEVLKAFEIKMAVIAEKNVELEKAGRLIGNLERILTLIFVLLGQFGAIGFLMAAKSILRFRDTATAKTEYVLIGTLLSFGVAIVLGVAVLKLRTLV